MGDKVKRVAKEAAKGVAKRGASAAGRGAATAGRDAVKLAGKAGKAGYDAATIERCPHCGEPSRTAEADCPHCGANKAAPAG